MGNIIHGGDIYSRKIKYDFSANINPLGMPEKAVNAIRDNISYFEAYPDIECRELVKSISEYENTDKSNILCGNGAADLIYRIVYALKPAKALLTAPAFSEYEHALKNIDCKIDYETLYETDNFELTETVLDKISDADIFFLCSPNNPVGNTVKPELLKEIVDKCAESGTQLVVDECFMDFVADNERLTSKQYLNSGVMVLKAFTKIFAMAGLRLGYIICGNHEIIDKLKEAGSCWSVSSAAQIAGVAALKQSNYIEKTKSIILAERAYIENELEILGIKTFPSEANFILFKSNIDLEKKLLEEKIAVRSCRDYMGLGKEFIRIAVKNHDENVKLINAVERNICND